MTCHGNGVESKDTGGSPGSDELVVRSLAGQRDHSPLDSAD
ncbi:MAG: hypothetical protein ACRDWI_19955 [Jiangellaceae bacterium]